jgi:hypothetical protein
MKSDAYGFASEVDLLIEAKSNEQYHCRIGHSKKLREELHPLSRLGLHFKQPGLIVEVEGFEDSGRPDGNIRITGFIEREFEVQITFADYGYNDKLRDELFVSQGFTPEAGDIQREKPSKKIVATMAAVDCDEHIGRIAAAVRERFTDKTSKPYARGTVLLIAFDEIKLFGRINWHLLFSKLDQNGGFAGSSFDEVYLFNCATNELYKAA